MYAQPAIASTGPATAAPRIALPPAIPRPPVARDPPPIAANVALVAATPDNAEILIPVEAAPRAITPP
ncbi:hypothetical protein D3C77_627380 [compost metagenome]